MEEKAAVGSQGRTICTFVRGKQRSDLGSLRKLTFFVAMQQSIEK